MYEASNAAQREALEQYRNDHPDETFTILVSASDPDTPTIFTFLEIPAYDTTYMVDVLSPRCLSRLPFRTYDDSEPVCLTFRGHSGAHSYEDTSYANGRLQQVVMTWEDVPDTDD